MCACFCIYCFFPFFLIHLPFRAGSGTSKVAPKRVREEGICLAPILSGVFVSYLCHEYPYKSNLLSLSLFCSYSFSLGSVLHCLYFYSLIFSLSLSFAPPPFVRVYCRRGLKSPRNHNTQLSLALTRSFVLVKYFKQETTPPKKSSNTV